MHMQEQPHMTQHLVFFVPLVQLRFQHRFRSQQRPESRGLAANMPARAPAQRQVWRQGVLKPSRARDSPRTWRKVGATSAATRVRILLLVRVLDRRTELGAACHDSTATVSHQAAARLGPGTCLAHKCATHPAHTCEKRRTAMHSEMKPAALRLDSRKLVNCSWSYLPEKVGGSTRRMVVQLSVMDFLSVSACTKATMPKAQNRTATKKTKTMNSLWRRRGVAAGRT